MKCKAWTEVYCSSRYCGVFVTTYICNICITYVCLIFGIIKYDTSVQDKKECMHSVSINLCNTISFSSVHIPLPLLTNPAKVQFFMSNIKEDKVKSIRIIDKQYEMQSCVRMMTKKCEIWKIKSVMIFLIAPCNTIAQNLVGCLCQFLELQLEFLLLLINLQMQLLHLIAPTIVAICMSAFIWSSIGSKQASYLVMIHHPLSLLESHM